VGVHTNVHLKDIQDELREAGWHPIMRRGTHERWGKGKATVEFTIKTGGQVSPAGVREVRTRLKKQQREQQEVEKGKGGGKEQAGTTQLIGGSSPEIDCVFFTKTGFEPIQPLATRIVVTQIEGDAVFARNLGPPLGPEFIVRAWEAEAVKAEKKEEGKERVHGDRLSSPTRDMIVEFVSKQPQPVRQAQISAGLGIDIGRIPPAIQEAVNRGLLTARGNKKARRYWRGDATDAEWGELFAPRAVGAKTPSEDARNRVSLAGMALVLSALKELGHGSAREVANKINKDHVWTMRALKQAVAEGEATRRAAQGGAKDGGTINMFYTKEERVVQPVHPRDIPVASLSERLAEALGVPQAAPDALMTNIRRLRENNKQIVDELRQAGWLVDKESSGTFIARMADQNKKWQDALAKVQEKLDACGVARVDSKGHEFSLNERLDRLLKGHEVAEPSVAQRLLSAVQEEMIADLLKKLDNPGVRFVLGRAPEASDVIDRIIAAGLKAVLAEMEG
jgi:hypothetical protein